MNERLLLGRRALYLSMTSCRASWRTVRCRRHQRILDLTHFATERRRDRLGEMPSETTRTHADTGRRAARGGERAWSDADHGPSSPLQSGGRTRHAGPGDWRSFARAVAPDPLSRMQLSAARQCEFQPRLNGFGPHSAAWSSGKSSCPVEDSSKARSELIGAKQRASASAPLYRSVRRSRRVHTTPRAVGDHRLTRHPRRSFQ